MNWTEYQQQALTTAIYPLKRELEYTVLGLCSEVGELGEAYAVGKVGWGYTAAQTTNFLAELGDVYWYVAAVADALNTPLQHIVDLHVWPESKPLRSRGLTILAVVASASALAGIVKKAIRDNDGFLADKGRAVIQDELFTILVNLDRLAKAFGSNAESVTAKNLNKLADRKKRGVLQGSGDNR